MEFRPCIDIHNGQVKQIVGGSLKDEGNQASENYVSEQDAAFYARLYQKQGIRGGHVILLNKKAVSTMRPPDSRPLEPFGPTREACRSEAAFIRKMQRSIWMQEPAM